MRPGGVIIPIPLEDGKGIWTCGAAIWGMVTGTPRLRDENTRKGTRKRLDFTLRTVNTRTPEGQKSRGKFQRAYITSENLFFWILHAVEPGDTLLLFGEYKEREYYSKKRRRDEYGNQLPRDPNDQGELKLMREFQIQFAIPAQAIVDPVSYYQRFTASPDEHYGYRDPNLTIGDEDDEEEPGYDDWAGTMRRGRNG